MMTISPFVDGHLTIISYPSPDFDRQLNRLVKNSGVDAVSKTFSSILPYCVFIKNNTGADLSGLVTRYDFRDSNGRAAHFTYLLINQNRSRPEENFAASAVTLITPIPSLRGLLENFGNPRNWPAEIRLEIQNAASEFVTRRDVTFSIDAAIYQDGLIVGLDKSNTQLRLNTTLEAEAALLQKLRETQSSLGQSGLISELRNRAEKEPDEAGDPDFAINKRKYYYQKAQQYLAKKLLSKSEKSNVDVQNLVRSEIETPIKQLRLFRNDNK